MGQEAEQDDGSGLRMCRICLDTNPSPTDADSKGGQDSPSLGDEFVSPCACTGTQAYVHLQCLRRWQMAVLSSQGPHANYNPAVICSVCRQRFTIAPPKRALALRLAAALDCYAREVTGLLLMLSLAYVTLAYHFNMHPLLLSANEALQSLAIGRFGEPLTNMEPGTLLVASPSMPPAASLFYRSVVLVYEHGQGRGTLGVILNKPLQEEELAGELPDLPSELATSAQEDNLEVSWGGPVARHQWLLLHRCSTCVGKARCPCGCSRGVTAAHSLCPDRWQQLVSPGLCLSTDLSLVPPSGSTNGDTATGASNDRSPLGRHQPAGSDSAASKLGPSRQSEASESVPTNTAEAAASVPSNHSETLEEVLSRGSDTSESVPSKGSLDAATAHPLAPPGAPEPSGSLLLLMPFLDGGDEEETKRQVSRSQPFQAADDGGEEMELSACAASAGGPSGAGEAAAVEEEEEEEEATAAPAPERRQSKEEDRVQPSHLLLLGRAGWREGQLAAEIKAGWWIVVPDAADAVLSYSPARLWHLLSSSRSH